MQVSDFNLEMEAWSKVTLTSCGYSFVEMQSNTGLEQL